MWRVEEKLGLQDFELYDEYYFNRRECPKTELEACNMSIEHWYRIREVMERGEIEHILFFLPHYNRRYCGLCSFHLYKGGCDKCLGQIDMKCDSYRAPWNRFTNYVWKISKRGRMNRSKLLWLVHSMIATLEIYRVYIKNHYLVEERKVIR